VAGSKLVLGVAAAHATHSNVLVAGVPNRGRRGDTGLISGSLSASLISCRQVVDFTD
jgi:hypothetical protein